MEKYLKFFIGIALLLTLSQLSACNTMEGFGKDIKKSGEAIEEKAN